MSELEETPTKGELIKEFNIIAWANTALVFCLFFLFVLMILDFLHWFIWIPGLIACAGLVLFSNIRLAQIEVELKRRIRNE